MGGRYIPADRNCFFEKVVVTDDAALAASSAFLHVRKDGSSQDSLVVMPDGRVGINYSIDGNPGTALPPATGSAVGTAFFVNGDQRSSGTAYSLFSSSHRLALFPVGETDSAEAKDFLLAVPGRGDLRVKSSSPNIGSYGLGAPWGEIWFDGGPDAFTVFANTGVDGPDTGIQFMHNYSAATYPYPAGEIQSTLGIQNDGRVGVGFNLQAGAAPPEVTIPDATGTYAGQNYVNVRLFVRDGALIESDLWVGGQGRALGGFSTGSDRRWKFAIRPIQDAIKGVMGITGVTHRWKQGPDYPKRKDSEEIGFIAQEVEKYFPQVISEDSKGYKWVDYMKLLPVLWEAFKENFRKTQELEARVESLENLVCLDHPEAEFCQARTK